MQLDIFAPPVVYEPDIRKLLAYDYILLAFSGGKDSIACYLHLREMGVPAERIELWHHKIDGNEGSSLMDWPITTDYCQKFADAMGSKIYFSWRDGGFEREMLREDAATAPVTFEHPFAQLTTVGGTSTKVGTRLKFPQVSGDLKVRWCSAYLKIMVMNSAIAHQPRFTGRKTLVVTGERAEESTARAKYVVFGPHYYVDCKKRKVDHWRCIHKRSENWVWEIMRRWKINPHPCYKLGWGRCSCAACIFGSKKQFASLYEIARSMVERIINYEIRFNTTIKRDISVAEMVKIGIPYTMDPDDIKLAMSHKYYDKIIVEEWLLPQGAFTSETCGPS